MISYIDSIQVLLSIGTIIGIALLTSFLKMFDEKDISTFRRTIFFVALPALVFYRIALRELIYETWQPVIHSLCTQITLNVIFVIITLIIPFKNRFHKYLEIVFSCSCSSFFYGYEIINILFGEEFIFIPVISSIVHYFLMNPMNAMIICFTDKDDESNESNVSHNSNNSDLDDLDDGIEDKTGLPIHPVEPIQNENDDKKIDHQNGSYSDNSVSSIGDIENPNQVTKTNDTSNQNKKEEDDDQIVSKPEFENNPENIFDYPDEIDSINEDEKFKDEDDEIAEAKELTRIMKFKYVLKKFLSPLNIAVILGIIWSIWHWKVPILIEKTSNFLELAVPATGFTCIGLAVWNSSLFDCNWIEVLVFLLIHYIVLPFIAILWSYIFKFDNKMATICILVNVAPISFSGYTMAMKSGLDMKSVSSTFVWSNIVFIPIFMVWVLGLNMTHLFGN